MNCFECATRTPSRAESGVAVCVMCGAAMCAAHATIAVHHLTRVQPLNRIVAVEPSARHLYCPTCAAAVDAQAHPPDHSIHLHHSHH